MGGLPRGVLPVAAVLAARRELGFVLGLLARVPLCRTQAWCMDRAVVLRRWVT